MATAFEIASELAGSGYRPVPVPFKKKRPVIRGWQKLRLEGEALVEYFGRSPGNVGVLLGEPSGWLVDVDLDCTEAVALAEQCLPATATFGRASKRRSHYLYKSPHTRTAKFKDPVEGSMLLELRSTGCQTIMPGSTHVSGEPIEWTNEERTPREVEAAALLRAVQVFACACLLARYWPAKGSRHDVALHFAGAMAHSGSKREDTERLLLLVAEAAGCTDLDRHVACVTDSYAKLAKGEPVSGWPSFAESMPHGELVSKQIRKWLGLRSLRILAAEPKTLEQRPPDTKWFELTELGNAEHLVHRHGRDLRYCHQWGKWLVWNERAWSTDETGEVERRAKETIRSKYAQASQIQSPESRTALAGFARSSESYRSLVAMLKHAASEPGIPVVAEEMNADPWLLPVQNATIDLRNGTAREHRRKDLCTGYVDVLWDPAAECPRWKQFLLDGMAGNVELVEFLQRAIGYTLTGDTREQVLFFLIGAGSNGKSTFIRVLQRLLGYLACQAAPGLLLLKRNDTHPTEQADLFGKRLVVATEIGEGRSFAEETIKQLTGEDKIRARRMREDFWEFDPQHKIWVSANHKPTVRGTDYAIWRRLLLVPFDVVFGPDRKDPTLFRRLSNELPGILHWAVAGTQKWLANGLNPPRAVLAAVAKYREEMDTIGRFLGERTTPEPKVQTSAADLYASYKSWCEAEGEEPVRQRQFGRALSERGFERVKRSVYYYIGLRLRDERDDPDQDPGSPESQPSRGVDPETSSASSHWSQSNGRTGTS